MAGFSFDPASPEFFSPDLFDPLAGLRMPTVASPPMVPQAPPQMPAPAPRGAGILAKLMGADRGYGASPETQRLSVLSSFLDAGAPAAFRAGLTGNKWLGIAQTLGGARKGYEASLQQDYERRRQEAKDRQDAATSEAQLTHYRGQEARAAEQHQMSKDQLAQKRIALAQGAKILAEGGAPQDELQQLGVAVAAGDVESASKLMHEMFNGLPAREKARGEDFLRQAGLQAQAAVATEQAKYDAGFGERRDDERQERQFNAGLAETKRYHDASLGTKAPADEKAMQEELERNTDRVDKRANVLVEERRFGGDYERALDKARQEMFGAIPTELAVLVDQRDVFWQYRMQGIPWSQILEAARAKGMIGPGR